MEKNNVLSAYVELRQRQRDIVKHERLKHADQIKNTLLREIQIIESLNP